MKNSRYTWLKDKLEIAIFESLAFSTEKTKFRIYNAYITQFFYVEKNDINKCAWKDLEYLKNNMNFGEQTEKICEKVNVYKDLSEEKREELYLLDGEIPSHIEHMYWKTERKLLNCMKNIYMNLIPQN